MRIKIVEMLDKGPKCVGDIQKGLKIAQPPTSHHLKLLVKIGVLNYRRAGKNTFYSLVPGIVDKALKIMDQLVK
jgi:ArsR family transcriptional regulator